MATVVRFISGTYVFIPEWNDNKEKKESDQIRITLKKPSLLERETIIKTVVRLNENPSVEIDKKEAIKCIESIENLQVDDAGRSLVLDITKGEQLLLYPGFYHLVDEIISEVISLDEAKE